MKNRIEKILFPTDFSDTAQNAFIHCLILAKELKAKVTLLHIIYPEYEVMDLPIMAAKATQDKVEAARITLQSFYDYCLASLQKQHELKEAPEVRMEVEVGSPLGVVQTVSRRDKADLIIMGTKGHHNAMERAFGSMTMGVMERVNIPVLIIPERADYHRVAVAVYATDLEKADPAHLFQISPILEAFHSILHLVHIDTGSGKHHEVDLAAVEKMFAKRSPALQVRFHNIRDNDIEKGLAEFVENHAVDVLIMFAPYHSLLDRIFQRSYTRRMALETHVPLLLIKNGEEDPWKAT